MRSAMNEAPYSGKGGFVYEVWTLGNRAKVVDGIEQGMPMDRVSQRM